MAQRQGYTQMTIQVPHEVRDMIKIEAIIGGEGKSVSDVITDALIEKYGEREYGVKESKKKG